MNRILAILLLAYLSAFVVPFITSSVTEMNEHESALIDEFERRFDGTPNIVESESKYGLLNYMFQYIDGFNAYYFTLEHDGSKYHAYIEKDLTWSIRQKAEPAVMGNG